MREAIMTDEHCRALDKIVLVARYLSLQSDIVQDHKEGEPFPFRPGELAEASKLLCEVEEVLSELVYNLPTEDEQRRKNEEKKLPKSERERRKNNNILIEQACSVMKLLDDGPDKLAVMAKLGRLLKVDPDKVLAFISGAEEPELTTGPEGSDE
jgi:hypothetical protein